MTTPLRDFFFTAITSSMKWYFRNHSDHRIEVILLAIIVMKDS